MVPAQNIKFNETNCCPWRSCYAEGAASAQTVAADSDVAFADFDIVGGGITVSADGTTFTATRTGLYHVTWSINLATAPAGTVIGIMENGESASAITSSLGANNVASGALINVKTVPFTFSLHNFNGEITLENAVDNTAASIRILRFADGPMGV